MRSICKKGPAILAGALALCALTAASASAAQWYVGGKAMTGSENSPKRSKSKNPSSSRSKQGCNATATLTCSGMTAGKSEIASGAMKLSGVKLTGCILHEQVSKLCELEGSGGGGESIGLAVAEAKLAAGKSPEDTAELAATGSPKTLFQFFTNENCDALPYDNVVQGSVTLQAPKGQTEAAEQEFTGEGMLSKNLKIEGKPVYLTGKLKLKLASGKAWSFH